MAWSRLPSCRIGEAAAKRLGVAGASLSTRLKAVIQHASPTETRRSIVEKWFTHR
jgi:hypothetical protein